MEPVLSGFLYNQGSVLGPLLFLLYLDDIHHAVSHSSIQLFADHVALYKQNLIVPSLNSVHN